MDVKLDCSEQLITGMYNKESASLMHINTSALWRKQCICQAEEWMSLHMSERKSWKIAIK